MLLVLIFNTIERVKEGEEKKEGMKEQRLVADTLIIFSGFSAVRKTHFCYIKPPVSNIVSR